MLTLASKVVIPAHVYVTRVDGDIVLLNTQTSRYFALKDVGTRIWEMLKDGRQLMEIHAGLMLEYKVDAQQLEQDILELLQHLLQNGLIDAG